MRARLRHALFATLLLGGCGDDDPSGPSPDEVAGVYEAAELTYFSDGDERNLLQEGAFIDITLHADGVTEGAMFIPAVGEGAALTGALDGTWQIEGTRVTFQHADATFIRDAAWIWDDGGLLRARFFTSEGRLDVTLSRGDPTTGE